MNLKQFLLTMRARYQLVLLVLLCTVVAGLLANQYLPRRYVATAAVAFDLRSPDPVAGVILPVMLATQVEIISSERVARKVVKLLKLDQNPALQAEWQATREGSGSLEAWLAASLQRGLEVLPSRETNVVRINYRAFDPGFAAAAANAYAQAYLDTTIEMRIEPARHNSRWLEEQGKVLRENVEKAQTRLSAYQQQKGIVASDEKVDHETARLGQLSAQLTVLQEYAAELRSKQKSGASNLPEIQLNPLIQSLRADIARLEVRLQEANLGTSHPQYQRMETELVELKKKLASETRHITEGFLAASQVSSAKEAELKAAIEAQRRRLLELRTARDQVAVLQRDVDAAQKIYDTVMQRFNQTSLETQATLTNVSIFAPALEPTVSSFPKPLNVMLAISLFLGAALGIGAALGLEMLDRRIRGVDDVAEMLQTPVLGVIARRTPHRPELWRREAPPALRQAG